MGRPECPHGDDFFACPPCQRQSKQGPIRHTITPKATSDTSRMNARFKSQCPACRGLIRIDDPIIKLDEGWVHEETCAP